MPLTAPAAPWESASDQVVAACASSHPSRGAWVWGWPGRRPRGAAPQRRRRVAQNGPPNSLSERHKLIALMVIGGATNVEIGEALDFHPTRVAAIKSSPLFQALVEQHRRELQARTVGGVVDKILGEGLASVAALVRLRDSAENESVQRSAASDLLDRNPQVARITREDHRAETRVIFDTESLRRLANAVAEDGGDEAPPAVIQALSVYDAPVVLKPLADAVAEALAAETAVP